MAADFADLGAKGTTVADFFGMDFILEQRIVAGLLNHHLVGLDTPLYYDQKADPVSIADDAARPVIRQASQHMFHTVMASLFPQLQVQVGQSLLGGYFYELQGECNLEQVASQASQALERLRLEDRPFRSLTVSTEVAARVLGQSSASKAGLLRVWPHPLVRLVSLNGALDIQHGPYPLSTAFLPELTVRAFGPGLVLQFASEQDSTGGGGQALLRSYLETRDWNRMLGVANVGQLNQSILEDRFEEVVRLSEALHEKKLVEIAREVHQRKVRVVCLAGPSSSGKSTVAHRLATQLQVAGLRPSMLSLDNYYRDRTDMPKDSAGLRDFEAPEALDLPLLSQHLEQFFLSEKVRVPQFDFVHGVRIDEQKWTEIEGGPNRVLLVEGLHALNPRIWTTVASSPGIYRIFVSALTQLVIDEHNRIQTSKVRLLRRIVRDRRYRGTPAGETLLRWRSVRRGEELHVFPFQEETDALFNSSLVYEAAVLKVFAQRYLLEVPRDHPAQGEAHQLLKFLELFVPVFPDVVPSSSLLREFIGVNAFRY